MDACISSESILTDCRIPECKLADRTNLESILPDRILAEKKLRSPYSRRPYKSGIKLFFKPYYIGPYNRGISKYADYIVTDRINLESILPDRIFSDRTYFPGKKNTHIQILICDKRCLLVYKSNIILSRIHTPVLRGLI